MRPPPHGSAKRWPRWTATNAARPRPPISALSTVFRLSAWPAARHSPQGGQRDYRGLFRLLPPRQGVHGSGRGREAKRDGYVSTIFGRRRYLNDIASRNAVARGLAERNAVNAPIQGSAADIMKIAMIRVSRRFRRGGIRSKVILQVHDELVVDMLRSGAGARHRHRYRSHGVRRCAARAAGGGLRRGRQLARSALMSCFDRLAPCRPTGRQGFYLKSACGGRCRAVCLAGYVLCAISTYAMPFSPEGAFGSSARHSFRA